MANAIAVPGVLVEPEELLAGPSGTGCPAPRCEPPDLSNDLAAQLVSPPALRGRADAIELSVVIPVYNEAATVHRLIRRVLAAPYHKELIIVDDGSTDGTAEALQQFAGTPNLCILTHAVTRGKGAAIRTGLDCVRGPFTIIQDADLEYDPWEYPKLIECLKRGEAQVVYGSRYLERGNRTGPRHFRLAVKLLNWTVRLLYGATITDEATCYKAFDTRLLRSLDLQCERFEFCPEVTAKVLRAGHAIVEVPIRFAARTVAQGKKIGWRDAFQAFWTLARYRVAH